MDQPRIQFKTEGKPSLFFGPREYKFFNDIAQELVEVVVRQEVKYYAIEEKLTSTHPLYGESKKKVFRQPTTISARILYQEPVVTTGQFVDRSYSIDVYFQKEVLFRAINANPRIGDFIEWDGKFFEITSVIEPQIIQGLPEFKFAIICNCSSVRQGVFDPNRTGNGDISYNTQGGELKR